MSQPLGTLVKAMNVLDALGEQAPVGVLELARRLELDKSAVSRILTTFRTRGYVRVNTDGRYDLGLRLFELGQALQERMPVRETMIPHVDAIAQEIGETAFAVHYNHGQIAYLYDCVSTQDIRLGERVGRRVPPWNHVAGKAILAFMDEAEVLEMLATARSEQRKGLPTVNKFRCELAQVRKQGYASERDAEKCLFAVPVMNDISPVCSALMLGGPAFRLPQSRIKSLAKLFKTHANAVSYSLGWIAKP